MSHGAAADAAAELARQRARLGGIGLDFSLIARGRATVDVDRAEAEVGEVMAVRDISGADDDELLGARCRIITTGTGDTIALLEPFTEGRLAAALARFGEGHVVDYVAAGRNVVAAASAAGVVVSLAARGPFGRQRLVLGGPRWGPFVVIVERAATIQP